ncbi:MAG: hypothetical protein J6W64_04170 [Bacilli bacterium]|nr:hypothetical protein [Bacilli bacterium]
MDIRLALMTGTDIPIPECQLTMHQPSVKEIAYIGENDFFKGVQTLCLNKSMFVQEGKTVPENITNFYIFMTIVGEKQTADKAEAVKQVLALVFPQYKIMFSPQSIIFQKDQETYLVDENNFEQLQVTLREVFCSKSGPMDQQAFNPANQKAREIAEKLMRGRQRVAEQNGSANASVFSQYLSTLSIGLHIPVGELEKYTMFQLFDSMERYLLYINWDIDIRSRLAGAKPDGKPDNWMKNIH